MKRLAETNDRGINIAVDKLDSGKFQLTLTIADQTPLRYRARTVEELVPISLSGHPANMYPEAIRTCVYDADDSEYASHADARAEHAQWCIEQAERDRKNAMLLERYTNK